MIKGPEGEEPSGALELSAGVLFLRWRSGAVVGEADAESLRRQAGQLCAGRVFPMLIEMTGLTWMDHGARAVFSAPWPLSRMAIVGASPVDEVIASFYTARHSLPWPTRFFTTVSKAMIWLYEAGPEPGAA